DPGLGGTGAVIGPNADPGYNQLGDYTSPQPADKGATVLAGIRAKLGAERVLYAPGGRIRGEDRDGFPLALEMARRA
ncbi:glycoside hydrolase family 3 C-terminal domain-containing protein, partial [Cohnella sp. GbtcB17]|uniref:glycoside hydrolase family 3 C-terminal domain-containing protein n=1 Tax=Cohnella sp. GbtcB17 TaxID=2824762 RepID=UPI001C30E20F